MLNMQISSVISPVCEVMCYKGNAKVFFYNSKSAQYLHIFYFNFTRWSRFSLLVHFNTMHFAE